jgi:hypothetical protein
VAAAGKGGVAVTGADVVLDALGLEIFKRPVPLIRLDDHGMMEQRGHQVQRPRQVRFDVVGHLRQHKKILAGLHERHGLLGVHANQFAAQQVLIKRRRARGIGHRYGEV